ncbi:MAG TPA: hypothetical protein VMU41_17815 [Candidatus Binataceae bacterium]|nr:hypothetical protein [Candidatus Binataceae bacterium]
MAKRQLGNVLRNPANDGRAAAGRWGRAARVAGITSIGAALMALMQISDPLGLTLLFNLGAPEMAFSVATGVTFLSFAALCQWLTLALAGALVTSPMAHLSAFIILSIVTSYLIYARPQLGRLWIWIQVPVLTDFYMIALQPKSLAMDNIQMFAGLLLAIGLLLLCNRWLWPQSAAVTLEESTRAVFNEARLYLHALRNHLSENDVAGEWERPAASRLGHHLGLLGPAIRQASTLAEGAELLLRVIAVERLRNEIEKLVRAIPELDRRISSNALEELATLSEAVERLLEETLHPAEAPAADAEHDRLPTEIRAMAEGVRRRGAAEPSIAPIAESYANIAEAVATDPIEQPAKGAPWPNERRKPEAVADRFLIRYSIRHTLALTIAFLIGLWDNAPALHAALWLLMLGGPPSHGATVRKFTMRAIGSAGALSLAAIAVAITAPNFASLLPYAILIFAGTLPLAYVAESSGIISFIGIGGTAFVIAFSGPGPRPDLVGSIWTIWGISLGMIIRAVLSAAWQERPARTLAEQFQSPLRSILLLLGDDIRTLPTAEVIAQSEHQLVYEIETILAVANDAMLEGADAAIDAMALIDAAGTLLRVGFLAGNVKLSPTEYSVAELQPLLEFLQRICGRWLDYLTICTDAGVFTAAPLRAMILAGQEAEADLSARTPEIAHSWEAPENSQLTFESSYEPKHLLETLFTRFELQASRIARDPT